MERREREKKWERSYEKRDGCLDGSGLHFVNPSSY